MHLGPSIHRAQASFQPTVVPLEQGEHGRFVPLERLHALARDVGEHDHGQALGAHTVTVQWVRAASATHSDYVAVRHAL